MNLHRSAPKPASTAFGQLRRLRNFPHPEQVPIKRSREILPTRRHGQARLDLRQPADVLPAHVGDLDEHLAHGGRLDGLQRGQEIVHLDFQLGQLVVVSPV